MINIFNPKLNTEHWHWESCAVFNKNDPMSCDCGYAKACTKWWKFLWFIFCIQFVAWQNFVLSDD